MGRSVHGATLLRLALVLMTSEFHNVTRGEPNGDSYVYRCANGHTRRLPRYYRRPPKCDEKGCGLRTKLVATPDKP